MIFNLNKNIFGLDISDQSLRLVHLRKNGKKFILSSHNDIAVPPDIIINGEIKKEEKLIQLLKQLVKTVKGKKITGKNVISVLPETKTFIKLIEIPLGQKEKENLQLEELIKGEIINHIPLALEEIYLDWQILSQNSQRAKILIGAAPKNIVDSYFSVLEKSGLTPYVLEIEAAAIIRSLLLANDAGSKIIIDFGAIRTGLIVYDHKTIQFTVSLPISGNKITETIAKILNLDTAKAERAKIVCGLDPEKCDGALLKILYDSMENLVVQIKKAMIFYQANFAENTPISEIVLSGGGANFSNIDQLLKEKLKLPVKIGKPLTNNIIQTKKLTIPQTKILSYTTAFGLALRPWQKQNLI